MLPMSDTHGTKPSDRGLIQVTARLDLELRAEGIVLDPAAIGDVQRALTCVDLLRVEDVFHSLGPICCSDFEDRARFTRAFRRTFSHGIRTESQSTEEQIQPGDGGQAQQANAEHAAMTAQTTERLRHREVQHIDLAEWTAWLSTMSTRLPRKRRRRWRPTRSGNIDLSRTLARWMRTSDHSRMVYRRRRRTHRRVELVIDISGSMRQWAPSYLLLAHALLLTRPRVRVHTLATRLTDVSRALQAANPTEAQTLAGTLIPDWSSGTRLGDLLEHMVPNVSGAALLVFSDGWEHGDITSLGQVAARLGRRAHSFRWVAPAAGRVGYRPATAGMRAVLPHLTALHAGTTPADLEGLLELLGDDRA